MEEAAAVAPFHSAINFTPIQFSIYFMALNEINGIEWFLFEEWKKYYNSNS